MFSKETEAEDGTGGSPNPTGAETNNHKNPLQTITRTLFDIIKEHGPITVANTWERVKEVGLKDLTSKNHMKVVLRWMRDRQKVRLVCNHVGAHKQFLYTTWFTNSASNITKKPY